MRPTRTLERQRHDDPCLSWDLATPSTPASACVLIVHGYGEHCQRYEHVVKAWVQRGLAVAIYDLRGHGLSHGPRAHVLRFADYVRDLMDILGALGREAAWRSCPNTFLFGHSLGGLIAFHAALAFPTHFSGLAMTSPFFALSMHVPAYKQKLGRLLSRWMPSFAMPNGLDGSMVSHDPKVIATYNQDPMMEHKATARWFVEVAEAQASAIKKAHLLTLPTYAVLGGADPIASTPASQSLLAKVSHARVDIAEGDKHEVLNETDRDKWIKSCGDAMLQWASGAC